MGDMISRHIDSGQEGMWRSGRHVHQQLSQRDLERTYNSIGLSTLTGRPLGGRTNLIQYVCDSSPRPTPIIPGGPSSAMMRRCIPIGRIHPLNKVLVRVTSLISLTSEMAENLTISPRQVKQGSVCPQHRYGHRQADRRHLRLQSIRGT